MSFPAGESVVVVRRPGRDKYGDQVAGSDVRTEYEDCGVADGSALGPETLGGHEAPVVSDYLLFLPIGADVLATDAVEVRGVECEVVGKPFTWSNPLTGLSFGVVVRANRGEG